MLSNPPKDSTLPSWFKFTLKDIKVRYESSTVLMGHHLIILVHDETLHDNGEPVHSEVTYESDPESEPAVLMAVDLRDSSIQEARVPEHLFFYQECYSFTKYKDNQIIKFGGKKCGSIVKQMVRITVTSFQRIKILPIQSYPKKIAFTVKCETIDQNQEGEGSEVEEEHEEEDEEDQENGTEDRPKVHSHAAQIYQDRLYVYGGSSIVKMAAPSLNDLWSFDLNNLTWQLCKTQGEGPLGLTKASSFVYQDKFYVYGGEEGEDLFALDFASMRWKKYEQKEYYFADRAWNDETELDGDIYKDNLLILGEGKGMYMKKLCAWNLKTHTWSTFELREDFCFTKKSNSIVYKNLLLVPSEDLKDLSLTILDLDQFDFPNLSKSPEQELFMNEAKSDIALKVQDQVILAHKQVLISRSRYFANLFNSGMAESRQDVIEINDCEFDVFKEFLRFLYFQEGDFKFANEDLAVKLLQFSDKYLQADLKQKCIDFFQYTLTPENVFKRLDIAHKENLPTVEKWCLTFLDNTMQFEKVFELIEYLNKEESQEFSKNNAPLQKIARELILDNYLSIIIEQQDKVKFCDEFLAKNVKIGTFVKLAKFFYGDSFKALIQHNPNWKDYERAKKESIELFRESTANLRAALFDFARENYEQLEEKKHIKKLPKEFLTEFESEKSKKGVKRMEPAAQTEGEEAKPTLKKTKK